MLFKFQYQNGKNEKVGKTFWTAKRGNKGIRDFKLCQKYYKSGQAFQIGAKQLAKIIVFV